MVVSHIHPSAPEGMAFLSETLVPALRSSSSVSAEGKEGEYEEAFFWTVDVHCADEEEEEEDSDDQSASGQSVGPSAYMARKVKKKK